MTRSPKRKVEMTRFQMEVVSELVEDDLAETDLRPNERRALEQLLEQINQMMEEWF